MRLVILIYVVVPATVLTFDVDLRKFAPTKDKHVGNGNMKELKKQSYAPAQDTFDG